MLHFVGHTRYIGKQTKKMKISGNSRIYIAHCVD